MGHTNTGTHISHHLLPLINHSYRKESLYGCKKLHIFIIAASLLTGIIAGSVSAVTLQQNSTSAQYPTNENGQTYGYFVPSEENEPQAVPQLIAAVGIGGTYGYINRDDLRKNLPSTPEEALEYMEHAKEKNTATRIDGNTYIDFIPLYTSDGSTVIGRFGITSNLTTSQDHYSAN